jgi:hypothetical protein
MEYNKPTIVAMGTSTEVIQGSTHKIGTVPDGTNPEVTCAAYEADE